MDKSVNNNKYSKNNYKYEEARTAFMSDAQLVSHYIAAKNLSYPSDVIFFFLDLLDDIEKNNDFILKNHEELSATLNQLRCNNSVLEVLSEEDASPTDEQVKFYRSLKKSHRKQKMTLASYRQIHQLLCQKLSRTHKEGSLYIQFREAADDTVEAANDTAEATVIFATGIVTPAIQDLLDEINDLVDNYRQQLTALKIPVYPCNQIRTVIKNRILTDGWSHMFLPLLLTSSIVQTLLYKNNPSTKHLVDIHSIRHNNFSATQLEMIYSSTWTLFQNVQMAIEEQFSEIYSPVGYPIKNTELSKRRLLDMVFGRQYLDENDEKEEKKYIIGGSMMYGVPLLKKSEFKALRKNYPPTDSQVTSTVKSPEQLSEDIVARCLYGASPNWKELDKQYGKQACKELQLLRDLANPMLYFSIMDDCDKKTPKELACEIEKMDITISDLKYKFNYKNISEIFAEFFLPISAGDKRSHIPTLAKERSYIKGEIHKKFYKRFKMSTTLKQAKKKKKTEPEAKTLKRIIAREKQKIRDNLTPRIAFEIIRITIKNDDVNKDNTYEVLKKIHSMLITTFPNEPKIEILFKDRADNDISKLYYNALLKESTKLFSHNVYDAYRTIFLYEHALYVPPKKEYTRK